MRAEHPMFSSKIKCSKVGDPADASNPTTKFIAEHYLEFLVRGMFSAHDCVEPLALVSDGLCCCSSRVLLCRMCVAWSQKTVKWDKRGYLPYCPAVISLGHLIPSVCLDEAKPGFIRCESGGALPASIQ